MTSDRDFDSLARAWLELGPNEAPDRVVAAVLQAADTTPQVRRPIRWLLWRLVPMNRLPLAAGAAAVLVAAIGGAILLDRGAPSGVGGQPPPAPTASPSPSLSPTAEPTLAPLGVLDINRMLPAGVHQVGAPFGAPFQFTTATPWRVVVLDGGEYAMGGGPEDNAFVTIDVIDNVYADPCRSNSGGGPLQPPIPKTLDGIVTALAAMKDFTVGPTTDIVIDGHPGKEFDLSSSLDPAAADECDEGALIPIWTTATPGGKTAVNPGATDHIAILDVDGTPVGIAWSANSTTLPELDHIVRTLDFD